MTYHACDKGQGAGVVFDRPEIVTFGQVSVQSHVSGNILSGVHRVASLAQAIDGGLVWENVMGQAMFSHQFSEC